MNFFNFPIFLFFNFKLFSHQLNLKPKRKRFFLNFKEKEEVTQKLKMSYTPDKLAAGYGLNHHTVYKLSKNEERFAQYRIDITYSPIRKAFKFSELRK